MDFVNETPFAAEVARAVLPYRDLMLATVMVKCGFDVSPSGQLSAAREPVALHEADLATPYGVIDGDTAPIKEGCDFAVMGTARPFPRRAVTEHDVRLRVGDFARRWRVYGDRRWRRSGSGFEASAPEPFEEMVLGYDKAYGGRAIYERRFKTTCDQNPAGKGLVIREEDVDGASLPNIEDGDEPIRTWRDRPTPAGLGPLPRLSTLRGARGYNVNRETGAVAVEPLAFSFSHPTMMLAAFPAGAPFELEGMGRRNIFAFTVPQIELSITLELGDRRHELALVPDTFCVFPDDEIFYVVARRAFVYQFIPERHRRISVTRRTAASASPPTMTIDVARNNSSLGVPIGPDGDDTAEFFIDRVRLNPMTSLLESLPLCASA